MNQDTKIILGSGSRFRRELLASTGLKFEVSVADCDEKAIMANSPSATAAARALAKAQAVSAKNPDALVIGCDQVLGHNKKVIDKVGDADAAFKRLMELQGDRHYLHSAYSLVINGQEKAARVVTITMEMKSASADEIKEYVATGEWQGCVGCYQFENEGGKLFTKVDGSEDAIVGLPLEPLKKDIESLLA